MKFQGGVREAAKMVQGLDPVQRKRVLAEIEARDPQMAQLIKENLLQFEDLIYLTPKMMGGLLQDISPEVFGLAMRAVSEEVRAKLLSLVSSNNARDMVEMLKGKLRPLTEVQEAQEKILKVVRLKLESGEIVLNSQGEKLV